MQNTLVAPVVRDGARGIRGSRCGFERGTREFLLVMKVSWLNYLDYGGECMNINIWFNWEGAERERERKREREKWVPVKLRISD